MYVVCVTIHVKPDAIDQFIEASLDNQRNTRALEPGNVRWDFLQAEDNPAQFFLYEVYKTKDDFPKHREMAHYLRWRENVESLMAEPRVGVRYFNIAPTDTTWNE